MPARSVQSNSNSPPARLIWNPILVSQRILHHEILFTLHLALLHIRTQSPCPLVSKNLCPSCKQQKFDGNPLNWMKWFSIFQATIGCSPISLSEKMIYHQLLLTGEAKHLIDGYGCNGSLYIPALNRLEEHFENPNRIVTAFLDNFLQFKPPNLTVPENYIQILAFLLTLVDTFQQPVFNHDIHSTTNLNQALSKLPTPVRLDWNKYALEKFSLQPSLKDLSEWLSIYAKACRDLPSPISVTRPSH